MKIGIFFLLLLIFVGLSGQRAYAAEVRIGLLSRFSERASIAIGNTDVVAAGGTFHSAGGFTVRTAGSGIALYGGGGRLTETAGPLHVRDAAGGFVRLEGVAYRGTMAFYRFGGRNLTAVNVLPLEQYLYSVVPSEMPPTWHPEALKAQAVAARTYALYNQQNPSHSGFDLCDRTCCQVYRGAEVETEATTQAVRATAGRVVLFEGEPINAVYFASSGGITEQPENVWQNPLPYLLSVPDPHEFEPPVWTRVFTLAQLSALASRNHAIGTVLDMTVSERHASGRVAALTLHGSAGHLTLRSEEIRHFFTPQGGLLPSRNFHLWDGVPDVAVVVYDGNRVQAVPTLGLYAVSAEGWPMGVPPQTFHAVGATGVATFHGAPPAEALAADAIVILGRGNGHGVGMSQRGAEGMARRGYGYAAILQHFYTGVELR